MITNLKTFKKVLDGKFDEKADKTNGVAQVTDNNASAYTNIGSLSNGATQQTINNTINTKLGNKADKTHTHGNISNDGKVTTTTTNVSRVLVTDGDVVKSISKLPLNSVTHQDISGKANSSHNQATTTITNSETYANIGSNLTTQKLINDNINTQLGNKISKVSNSTDLLLANGSTKAQSEFATSTHSHGSVNYKGQLDSDISSVNKIAVTDSSTNLKTISQLPYSKISGTPTKLTDFSSDGFTVPAHTNATDTKIGKATASVYGHTKAYNGTTTAVGTTASKGDDDGLYARGNHTHNITKATITGLGISSTDHEHGAIKKDGTMATANRFVITDDNKNIALQQKVGEITLDGKLASASNFVVTDSNKTITTSSKIGNITLDGKIVHYGLLTGNTPQKDKLVVTDSNGVIDVEEKSNYAVDSHTHGNISRSGSITSSTVTWADGDIPLISDISNSGKIERGYVSTSYIKDKTAYGNIGSSANDTQATINSKINTKMGSKLESVATGNINNGAVTFAKLGNDITDTTIGGNNGSTKLVTSDTLYDTLHSPNSPNVWVKVTDSGSLTQSSYYWQTLWYNPMTGLVELYMRTPYHKIFGTYTPISYLVEDNQTLDTSKLDTVDSLNGLTISENIRDYAPAIAIHGTARGSTSQGTTGIMITLDTKGKLWGRSFDGSTLVSKSYDLYLTYRCRLGHDTTEIVESGNQVSN